MPAGSILRSFSHRNFRLFFAGQGLSLIGTQMQIVALPWFVYRLTESEVWLAVVAFAGQFPAAVAAPLAGVIADRVDKRRLLLVTQFLAMVQAFALAILTLTDLIQVWHIVVLNVGMGLINAFDVTTRQAFLHEMIDEAEDLGNAIALNSAVFNTTRLIGPALAGQVIALVGEGMCFLANSVSFLAVLGALLGMRVHPRPKEAGKQNGSHLIEGVQMAIGSMPIRTLLALVAIVSFLALPYLVLLPVVVKVVLKGGAGLNGWIYTAAGVGSLIGGLFLASRRSVLGVVLFLPALAAIAGLAMIAMWFITHLAAVTMIVFTIGLTVVMLLTTCNTLLQTIVDDRFRGRILSLYAMMFMGLGPLGGVVSGWIAERWDVQTALVVGGALLFAAAIIFAIWFAVPLHRRVRDIYKHKGLFVIDVPEQA